MIMRQGEVHKAAVQHQDRKQSTGENDCPNCVHSGVENDQTGVAVKVEQPEPKFRIVIENQDELDRMAESFLHYAGPFINKTSHGTNTFSPYLVNKLLKPLTKHVSVFQLKFVSPAEWDVRFAEGTIIVPVQVYFSEWIEELLLSIANDRDGDQSKEPIVISRAGITF